MRIKRAQDSLVAHLKTGFTTPTVRTIKEYAGEMSDAAKLRELRPAIFVYFDRYTPGDETVVFDVIVATKSNLLDKVANQNANASLSSDVADFLLDSNTFRRNDFDAPGTVGTYTVQVEELLVENLLVTPKHHITTIKVKLRDNT